MSFYNDLVDSLSVGNQEATENLLKEINADSASIKSVLWLLSNPDSGWTVESLREYLDPNAEYCPDEFPEPISLVKEEEIVVDNNRVRELAYLLSERDGHPAGLDEHYWQKALHQLTPKMWYVESGDLKVSGYGELNDIILLAYTKAQNDNLSLSEITYVSSKSWDDIENNGGDIFIATQAKLKEFGMWS